MFHGLLTCRSCVGKRVWGTVERCTTLYHGDVQSPSWSDQIFVYMMGRLVHCKDVGFDVCILTGSIEYLSINKVWYINSRNCTLARRKTLIFFQPRMRCNIHSNTSALIKSFLAAQFLQYAQSVYLPSFKTPGIQCNRDKRRNLCNTAKSMMGLEVLIKPSKR
jgi:hypothetical protein